MHSPELVTTLDDLKLLKVQLKKEESHIVTFTLPNPDPKEVGKTICIN
mgnify:CR=1 FL=1